MDDVSVMNCFDAPVCLTFINKAPRVCTRAVGAILLFVRNQLLWEDALLQKHLQPQNCRRDSSDTEAHLQELQSFGFPTEFAGSARNASSQSKDVPPGWWGRRHELFSQFDAGIQMDFSAWYEVTAEVIATFIAEDIYSRIALRRLDLDPPLTATNDGLDSDISDAQNSNVPLSLMAEEFEGRVVVDACCGVGGNSISFAKLFDRVIAVDISLNKINMARNNSSVYEVEDKIEFVHANFIDWASKIESDWQDRRKPSVPFEWVFLSPPWGGLGYEVASTFKVRSVDGVDVLGMIVAAARIGKNVGVFLPRNQSVAELADIAHSLRFPIVEIVKIWHRSRRRPTACVAYFLSCPSLIPSVDSDLEADRERVHDAAKDLLAAEEKKLMTKKRNYQKKKRMGRRMRKNRPLLEDNKAVAEDLDFPIDHLGSCNAEDSRDVECGNDDKTAKEGDAIEVTRGRSTEFEVNGLDNDNKEVGRGMKDDNGAEVDNEDSSLCKIYPLGGGREEFFIFSRRIRLTTDRGWRLKSFLRSLAGAICLWLGERTFHIQRVRIVLESLGLLEAGNLLVQVENIWQSGLSERTKGGVFYRAVKDGYPEAQKLLRLKDQEIKKEKFERIKKREGKDDAEN